MNSSSEPLLEGLSNNSRRRATPNSRDAASQEPPSQANPESVQVAVAEVKPAPPLSSESAAGGKGEPQAEGKVKKGRWANHQPKQRVKPAVTGSLLRFHHLRCLTCIEDDQSAQARRRGRGGRMLVRSLACRDRPHDLAAI